MRFPSYLTQRRSTKVKQNRKRRLSYSIEVEVGVQYIIQILTAKNKAHLLAHSSISQKFSKISAQDITELKARCQAVSTLGTLGRNLLPSWFRLLAEFRTLQLQDWGPCFLKSCQLRASINSIKVPVTLTLWPLILWSSPSSCQWWFIKSCACFKSFRLPLLPPVVESSPWLRAFVIRSIPLWIPKLMPIL